MPPSPAPGPMMLLQNAGVQTELRLAPEQKTAIGQLLKSLMSRFQGEMRGGDGPNPEIRKKLATAAWTELPRILKPEQHKRLQQIELQARGAGQVLGDPAIQQTLSLSDEQKTQIRTSLESLRQEAQQAGGAREHLAQLRKEAFARTAAILTTPQNETLRNLLGEPFELQLAPGAAARPARPAAKRDDEFEDF